MLQEAAVTTPVQTQLQPSPIGKEIPTNRRTDSSAKQLSTDLDLGFRHRIPETPTSQQNKSAKSHKRNKLAEQIGEVRRCWPPIFSDHSPMEKSVQLCVLPSPAPLGPTPAVWPQTADDPRTSPRR